MLNRIRENGKKAVIRAIELMGLKHPEKIKEKGSHYTHTNTRGRTRYFKVMKGFKHYNKTYKGTKHKLHRVNGFYIVETDNI